MLTLLLILINDASLYLIKKRAYEKRRPLWRGNKPTVLFGDRLRFVADLFIAVLHLDLVDHFCPA
jgi:hypothetical protein